MGVDVVICSDGDPAIRIMTVSRHQKMNDLGGVGVGCVRREVQNHTIPTYTFYIHYIEIHAITMHLHAKCSIGMH